LVKSFMALVTAAEFLEVRSVYNHQL
jgi:hypothetical protein